LQSKSQYAKLQPDWTDTTGKNCTNLNHGFRGIDDCGNGIQWFRTLRVISHARCQAFASTRLGSRRVTKSDGMSLNYVLQQHKPFFLHLPHHPTHRHSLHCHHTRHQLTRRVLHLQSSTALASSSTSYSSRRIAQLPAVSASSANNVTKLADVLAASYSPSYTSSLTCLHTRRVVSYLVSSCRQYPHRHRTRRVVLYNLPLSVPLRAALIMSQSSPSYSLGLTRYCPCCRIDVILIASCLILQSRFVSDTCRAILPTLGTYYR